MPVPTATTRQLCASRPPPQRASPSAWAWTSLRTRQGSPNSLVTAAPSAVPPQPGMRSFANVTSPVRGSMTPALEMPTPATSPSARARAPRMASSTRASTARPPSIAAVGTFSTASTTGASPPSVTTPAAIFVPPISTATTCFVSAIFASLKPLAAQPPLVGIGVGPAAWKDWPAPSVPCGERPQLAPQLSEDLQKGLFRIACQRAYPTQHALGPPILPFQETCKRACPQ